jgi:hypothetical protein
MIFPVLVEVENGCFAASLPGVADLRVVEPTRDKALASLKAEMRRKIEQGELLFIEFDTVSVSDLAGKYSDDPTIREICEQAYKLRDAENHQ